MNKLLVFFMLLPLHVSANENAEIFFHDFIMKESQGGRTQRLDKVVYVTENYTCTSGAGEHIDAEFEMDVDSFYLISDYNVANKKIDDKSMFFDVSFSVVGEMYYPCGTKVINGKARLFKPNKAAMNVRYQMKKSGASWVLVNPPKPFVRCDVYKEFLDKELKQIKLLLEKNKKDIWLQSEKLMESEKVFLEEVCAR